MKRKEDEPGCVVGDDGGSAHRVVIGLQAGKLVVVGDEPQPAGEALIVVGVTGVEKHLLVPDDILQEFAVGERGPADIVGGEACQVEPVPREPFGMVREPAPVTLDMDQRGLLPESAYRRENRHGRGGIVEVGGTPRDRNASAMEPVPGGGDRLGHPRRHVCRPQPLEFRRAEGGLDRGDRLRGHVVLAEIPEGGERGARRLAGELQPPAVRGVDHPDGDVGDPDGAARCAGMEHGRRRHLGAELEPARGFRAAGKERNDERRAAGPPAGPGPSGAAARSRVRRRRAGPADLRQAGARWPRRRRADGPHQGRSDADAPPVRRRGDRDALRGGVRQPATGPARAGAERADRVRELDQALRVARTIVNALARAGLPAIAARDTEPSAEGARPRDVTEEPRRRAAPQPPL